MTSSPFFIYTFAFFPWVLAASHPDPIHVPILRRSKVSDRVANLSRAIDMIKHKYGFATNNMKRTGVATAGYVPLTDEVCMSLADYRRTMVSITQRAAK